MRLNRRLQLVVGLHRHADALRDFVIGFFAHRLHMAHELAGKPLGHKLGREGGFKAHHNGAIGGAHKAGLVVASEGPVVVGLETALTPELVAEGLAREFVSHVQAMRKEADYEVTQRIRVTVEADDELKAAIEAHRAYATAETLAVALDFAACGDAPSVDLNGHAAKIRVEKAEG